MVQPDCSLSELGLKSRSSHGRSLGCYSHISGYVRGMFPARDNSAIDQFIRGKRIQYSHAGALTLYSTVKQSIIIG